MAIPLPNQILRQARLDHNKSLPAMEPMLGVTFQRVHQWERGDPIGLDYIIRWSRDERLPAWLREAALQMWAATLQQSNAQVGAQLDRLQNAIGQVYSQLALPEVG